MGEVAGTDVLAEVVRLRASGYSWAVVAQSLNARGMPTPSGRGQWWPSSTRRWASPEVSATWAGYMRVWRGRVG